MEAILVTEIFFEALSEDWPSGTTDATKKDIQDLAYWEIILRLSDGVLRRVVNHTKPKPLWDALENIYSSKSMPSRINLLSKLYGFRMDLWLFVEENLDMFLKLTHGLASRGEPFRKFHQAVILFKSLPAQFDSIKKVMQYGWDEEKFTVKLLHWKMKLSRFSKLKMAQGNDAKNESKGEYMFLLLLMFLFSFFRIYKANA